MEDPQTLGTSTIPLKAQERSYTHARLRLTADQVEPTYNPDTPADHFNQNQYKLVPANYNSISPDNSHLVIITVEVEGKISIEDNPTKFEIESKSNPDLKFYPSNGENYGRLEAEINVPAESSLQVLYSATDAFIHSKPIAGEAVLHLNGIGLEYTHNGVTWHYFWGSHSSAALESV